MLFEIVALVGRKLLENIALGRTQLDCFFVIHYFHVTCSNCAALLWLKRVRKHALARWRRTRRYSRFTLSCRQTSSLSLSSKKIIRSSSRSFAGKPARTLLTSVLRSEEHTSELQSRLHLVCRLLLEKKK